MPTRGRYSPFNLIAFNKRLDHGLLLGLGDDDHTQYWLAGAGSGRTDDFTTTGTVTAGKFTAGVTNISTGLITTLGNVVLESTTGGEITLRNTFLNRDIIFSVVDAGGTETITLDASAFEWVSSTTAHNFKGSIIPSDGGNLGADLSRWGTVFGNTGNFSTSVLVGTLTIAPASITDSGGQISFGNNKLVLGNFASTLTGTTHERFTVDGDTAKIAVAGGQQQGYDFSNTYDGTLASDSVTIGYRFTNKIRNLLLC